ARAQPLFSPRARSGAVNWVGSQRSVRASPSSVGGTPRWFMRGASCARRRLGCPRARCATLTAGVPGADSRSGVGGLRTCPPLSRPGVGTAMMVAATLRQPSRAWCLVAGLGLLLFFGGSGPAHARRIGVTCTDGTPGAVVRDGSAPPDLEAVCDLDGACDGTCTFGFCGLGEFWCAHTPACVGPGSGICAPG